MSPAALATIARLHAIAGWAAAAALFAAAWFFGGRAREKLARGVGAAAAVLLLAAGGLGLWLHEPYRARLRQRLFLDAPALGWLFERKLHVAFAATLLALGALAAAAGLARTAAGAPERRDLARSAALLWWASAGLALAASIASAIVGRRAHF